MRSCISHPAFCIPDVEQIFSEIISCGNRDHEVASHIPHSGILHPTCENESCGNKIYVEQNLPKDFSASHIPHPVSCRNKYDLLTEVLGTFDHSGHHQSGHLSPIKKSIERKHTNMHTIAIIQQKQFINSTHQACSSYFFKQLQMQRLTKRYLSLKELCSSTIYVVATFHPTIGQCAHKSLPPLSWTLFTK